MCMSESGTCIASTSSSLTLRAHYVHHSSSIPFNLVFTCAGGMQESPTNCQREDGPTALVVTTYPIYLIPHKDGPLALVAPGPGPALEGGARPLTAPGSHKRPGAGPLISERRAGSVLDASL